MIIDEKYYHKVIRNWREQCPTASYKKAPFGKYKITPDGIEHLSKTLNIYDFMLDDNGELLLKFSKCNSLEIFIYDKDKLKSFKNFPDEIVRNQKLQAYTAAFSSAYDCDVSSLEGIPCIIGGGLCSFLHFPKLNLSNINKHIDYIQELSLHYKYKGPLLSILRLKNINRIQPTISNQFELNHAIEIINKHLRNEKDILECQEELITNGLRQYAKL
jgi:hypothetical protein